MINPIRNLVNVAFVYAGIGAASFSEFTRHSLTDPASEREFIFDFPDRN
jgi:hypothetical protein